LVVVGVMAEGAGAFPPYALHEGYVGWMSLALSGMDWHGGLALLDMMNLLYGYVLIRLMLVF
jgi:hypothetical protein